MYYEGESEGLEGNTRKEKKRLLMQRKQQHIHIHRTSKSTDPGERKSNLKDNSIRCPKYTKSISK